MRGVLRIINPYDPGIIPEGQVVNLSSNENPYEPSESVKRAFFDSIAKINRYPDASYSKLKKTISDFLSVEIEKISVGCGSSELISRVCDVVVEELDTVAVPMPSYSLYLIYAMLREANIVTPVFRDYKVEAEIFEELKPKLSIICSPNNPTGNKVKRKVVEKIVENSEFVLIDEAYVEFSDEHFLQFALEFDNVVVLRTFSKFFGLAGLRIGYAISSRELTEAIEKIRLPFAISGVAVEAAISAIKSFDYYADLRKRIVEERERMAKELMKLGLKVYPSYANFLLVKIDERAFDFLLGKGIMVRKIENILGLEGTHLRITVGRKEENDALIEALRSYLCESSAD
ncbi:MAG: histidinol-phosphate transaminase [Archaeoglobaceae archaeon]